MKNSQKILLVVSTLAFFALWQSAYAAPKVTPTIIDGEVDKLKLTYSNDLDPNVIYKVKRSIVIGGTPSGSWEDVGQAGKPATLPGKDTGLKTEVQYAYALFDESGATMIQDDWYSAIPNWHTTAPGSGATGAIGSGNPGAVEQRPNLAPLPSSSISRAPSDGSSSS